MKSAKDAAFKRDRWVQKNLYYNRQIIGFLKKQVPPGRKVLEIGCETGFLLNALAVQNGTGLDSNPAMIQRASQKYPHLNFLLGDAADYRLEEKFDYLVMADAVGYFEDVQKVFKNIRQNCTPSTRVIIITHNFLWEPLLKLAEFFRLKMKEPFTNWLSNKDLENLLNLEKFEVVKKGGKILWPKYLPLISVFLNKFLANLPLVKNLCLAQYLIARPLEAEPFRERSVSIIVPVKNEAGNIEPTAAGLPSLGLKTEIIFVEGGSTDNTWAVLEKVREKFPGKNIRLIKQGGQGKAQAVATGLAAATGEVLMIYDADRTVPPQDLFKFYEVITANKGELVIGNRLIYPLEKESMRFLNLLGNKIFSGLFSWLLDQPIKDTLCGTKVILKENYERIIKTEEFFNQNDPFGDFQLLFGASKLDLKITEIPVRYQRRTYGSTNIKRLAHGWLLLKMCLRAVRKIKFA